MTVASRIADYLATADLGRVRAHSIASHLCMSETTMRRRLRLEGQSLSHLIQEERKRRTVWLMSQPRINAARLSDACGYVSGHNFYRAFKSWFGRGYLEYRRSTEAAK